MIQVSNNCIHEKVKSTQILTMTKLVASVSSSPSSSFYLFKMFADFPGRHSPHSLGPSCERVEDAREKTDREVRDEQKTGRDCADWRGDRLLRVGFG